MITREEYIKALDIVEAYHKQISNEKTNISNKTPINQWDKLVLCKSRLHFALTRLLKESGETKYIEDIVRFDILRNRNTGKKTWEEFIKLRGY